MRCLIFGADRVAATRESLPFTLLEKLKARPHETAVVSGLSAGVQLDDVPAILPLFQEQRSEPR
jgi:hypothetical protein